MIIPTPITAAIAGAFSALVWPMAWARYGGGASSGGFELVVATLLLIALPAHALVVGFGPSARAAGDRSIDTSLLKRIGIWLAAAAITVFLANAFGR